MRHGAKAGNPAASVAYEVATAGDLIVPLPVIPFAAALLMMVGSAQAAGNPLLAERVRSRPLVLVAASDADPVAADFTASLAVPGARAALAERQVVVFRVIGGHGEREGRPLDPAVTGALLAALGVPISGPATILLVGKDGVVKLRDHRLRLDDILAAIDAMPMRRQEMR